MKQVDRILDHLAQRIRLGKKNALARIEEQVAYDRLSSASRLQGDVGQFLVLLCPQIL